MRFALLLACCSLPGAVQAQAILPLAIGDAFKGLPNVRVVYYDVAGTDEASISASFHAVAPKRPDGRTAWGMTEYDNRYSSDQITRGSQCRITHAKVEIYSTVHLPRLIDEAQVPERLMVQWRSFMKGLAVHEAGHVRIQNAHLADVETALIGSRCETAKVTLDAASGRIAALQKAYDRQTENGVTQGAILR